MIKKIIKRPLRIFVKNRKPYIIYKDKKYNIKSTEIKDVIKFINKLNKKTTKKIQTDNKPKKDIKKYLNETIKLIGGPTTSQNLTQNIEKDTFKINELNKKLEDKKIISNDLIKMLKNDKIDELISFDKKNNKYNLTTKNLIIEGDSIDDIKNKLDDGYNKLQTDIQDIINQKDTFKQEKEKFEELAFLQKQSIKNKEYKLDLKDKEINKKEKFINLSKLSTDKELKNITKQIFNIDRDSIKFFDIYNEFYNLEGDDRYEIKNNLINNNKMTNKMKKEDLINFIIDYENKTKDEQITPYTGEGKNDFGLYNYQIDKIMKPFKLYIKTIRLEDLKDMIKYIYDNNILIGSFILNINKHWVAIYFDFKTEYVLEYYDPFGEPTRQIIIDLFKNLILSFNINVFIKIKINKIQQQNINSSNCGWFSMYFLIMRYNNYTFKYITKFKDINKQEDNIEELKDKYDYFGFI